ncbi:MAG: hypothetical protein PHR36_03460 [Patescibacteria group bacterium]|nr:hypothetical protein [Patescibacteria group bacterium]
MGREIQIISNGVRKEIMPGNTGEEGIELEEFPEQRISGEQRQAERVKAEDLRRRLDALKEKNRSAIQNEINAFVKSLTDEFLAGEVGKSAFDKNRILRKYALFHILGGSTYEEVDCEYFDFPGRYSIEKFIEELEKEQGGEKKEK